MSSSGKYRSPLINTLRKAFFKLQEPDTTSGNTESEDPAEKFVANTLARRQFIEGVVKTGIAISTVSLLSACEKVADLAPTVQQDVKSVSAVTKPQPKIAIIGAGMAGLNCAYQLKKAGYTSSIYEGSKRVGGRIYSQNKLLATDLYTELGGEFIDSDHTDMLQLCNEFGLSLLDTRTAAESKYARDSFYIDGRFYSEDEVIKAFKPYAAKISADINSLPDDITFDNNDQPSQYFDHMSVSAYLDSVGMSGFIRKGIETAYLTEYGLDTNLQSAINFLFVFNADTSNGFEIFGSSDERYKIKNGNSTLTDKLYEQVKNQVNLQSTLKKIKQTSAGYVLYFNDGNAVTTINADIVVCTIPFSILRDVELQVALPTWKTNAIQKLGYGTNSKLLLGFTKRVWRQYAQSGYVFTNQALQNGWDNSWAQSGTNGGFTVYQGGSEGLLLSNGTPESQAPKFLDQLDRMWPGCKAAFNGRVQRMHWPTYQFTKGSYACYTVGQYTSIRGAEQKPIGCLHFAGEHCSLNFQGFMNGAAETGRMAANEILSNMGVQ